VDLTDDALMLRAGALEQYMDWGDRPTLMLAAWPGHDVDRIARFYEEDGIRGRLENPPQLRDAGFGIGWRAVARSEGGALVATDSHRIRWVEPNGSLFVAATADQEFLCRTSGRVTTPRPLAVSHIVLIEFTYLFCLFQHVALSAAIDGTWRLAIVVCGAESRPWKLRLGPRGHVFAGELRPPSADTWVKKLVSTDDPGRDAYALVARFYDLFGVGEGQIPFVADGAIDPDQLRNLGRA